MGDSAPKRRFAAQARRSALGYQNHTPVVPQSVPPNDSVDFKLDAGLTFPRTTKTSAKISRGRMPQRATILPEIREMLGDWSVLARIL